jgi:putative transposase
LTIYRSINALAENVNGSYKTELIYNRGPWRTVEDVELATLVWVHWWNTRRIHEALDYVTPLEYERTYYLGNQPVEEAAVL